MASSQLSRDPGESPSDGREVPRPAAESFLELLGDEYTQRVLTAIGNDAVTGSELIDRAGVSKATAYRRLDDLQEAGLVEATMRLDPDGHHCEQYRLAIDHLAISFGPDGFDVNIDCGEDELLDGQERRLSVPAHD